MAHAPRPGATSRFALERSLELWFVTVVAGQWAFIAYLVDYYIGPALRYGLAAWVENDLSTGYVDGDSFGNFAVATHILLATIILSSGQVQLVPAIRQRQQISCTG